jgi:mannose-6-phosphate isomerase-like protein (cupin superfamily)
MVLDKILHRSKKGQGALKAGFHVDIEDRTEKNVNFRQVLYTGTYSQLVVMSLLPGEEIGEETHADRDQFIRIEEGSGIATLNGETVVLEEDSALLIPAGVKHNVTNTSAEEPLQLYTIYSPPEHPKGTVHRTKKEAEASSHNH